MGAKYVFGNKNINNITSIATNFITGIMSNPQQLENILGIVRGFAPLASAQTVVKVNTYLPIVEKISSIVGMYSFLNNAQNYAPIQSLGDKPLMEKVTTLVSNGSIPISKILAQPIISQSIGKIITSVAGSFINNSLKNGGLDQILSGLMGNLSNNNSTNTGNSSQSNTNSNFDIGSIIETLGSLFNNNK
jgi:hypothetical protein